jgi:DNA polymerase III subunit delta
MRLRSDQLQSSLSRQGLVPLYLISGDEPLQVMEAVDRIRTYARGQGIDEHSVLRVEPGFDWQILSHEASNISLFGARRLIELRLGAQEPGAEGSNALTTYAERLHTGTILLISTGKLAKKTQQSTWFKAVEKAGVVIQVWPVEQEALPQWIMRRSEANGLNLTPDAAAFIAARVEGNLLAAGQEIDNLALLVDGKKRIDVEEISLAMVDNSRYDVFTWVDRAFAGELARSLQILHSLRHEGIEPAAISGVLTRELRSLCRMAKHLGAGKSIEITLAEFQVWDKRKPVLRKVLRRHSLNALWAMLLSAGRIDKIIKGAIPGNPWDELGWLCAQLTGHLLKGMENT